MNISTIQNQISKFAGNRAIALIVAIAAAWTGIFAIDGKAELSASLVRSLPPAQAQVFPMDKTMASIKVAQESVQRTELPKQPPKYTVAYTLTGQITGYNSEAAQTDNSPWYTADGTWCTEGVAAGPYNLPFGTRFRIPSLFGDRIFTVHDRSATPSGHFDIWFRTRQDALNLGRRTATVEVLV